MESPQLADLRGRFIRAARTLAGDTGSGPSSTSLSYFRNRGGFCGIAWNDAGITRFQLPTNSATATERMLLRQVPRMGEVCPTPHWREWDSNSRSHRRTNSLAERVKFPNRPRQNSASVLGSWLPAAVAQALAL